MAVDRDQALALEFEPLVVDIERGRLKFFASAIGETNPIYSDIEAAKAAGHPDLPVPPTFFFSCTLEAEDSFWYLGELGIDLRFVLHGEQSFTYHGLAYAGDRLTLRTNITDVYAKRGGSLEFLVNETEFVRGKELVAVTKTVVVVRNPEGKQ